MRKYLRYANLFVLAAGSLGILLMSWLFSGGTDERGLYPANHPAWILLGILTVAVLAAIWLVVRQAGTGRGYRQNFPASIPAALGYVAAGIGLISGGIHALEAGKALGTVTGILGIVGGIPMFWAAVCRFRGQRSKLPVHIAPCFFFALQLFVLGQEFGSEPEMCRYLYRFWAAAATVPACYWLWSFDVNLGKRRSCLFWCLAAGYCHLAAGMGSGQWLLHGCMAFWMLTALPRLRYLPKPQHPAPEADPDATQEPVPAPQEPPAEEVLPVPEPLAVDLPDTNAILEELLRDYGQQENP